MALTDKLTAIANAIRGKTGGTESLTLDQMATEIERIKTGGGEDSIRYVINSQNLYHGAVFPDGYEIKVISAAHQGNMQAMFTNTKGIRKITLNVPTGVNYNVYNFARESSVEEIVLPDGIHFTSWNYFGYYSNNLRRIIGRIDCSGHAPNNNNCLNVTRNLEEVYFMPGTIDYSINFASSPNLIDASIQSIIDGLADLTGGTAQTLTLHATVGGKLTDAQKATITAKNWTLAY